MSSSHKSVVRPAGPGWSVREAGEAIWEADRRRGGREAKGGTE